MSTKPSQRAVPYLRDAIAAMGRASTALRHLVDGEHVQAAKGHADEVDGAVARMRGWVEELERG